MRIVFKIALVSFLLFFIFLSFKRYYYFPLDGDLPGIVLPAACYIPVMKDPFAINVIVHDSVYAAPNRFFTHFFLSGYFKTIPLWLQRFFAPLDSVYIACALAKTAVHFCLIYLIALLTTNRKKFWNTDVLLVASIINPLFQTYGYYDSMSVIDNSITYVFFYAMSLTMVFLFFLPFFNALLERTSFNFSWLKIAWLLFLMIVCTFSGPLNAPVILLTASCILLFLYKKNYFAQKKLTFIKRAVRAIRSIPRPMMGLLAAAIAISLYSLYVGRNNSENLWESLPLSERYSRLPKGFWYQYTFKLGLPLLITVIVFNFIIVSRIKPDLEAKKMITAVKWFGGLCLIYIALLPLGGYRSYRPNIIRFDTILPVTIGLIFFYGYSTYYMLKHLPANYTKYIYTAGILFISWIYINADQVAKVRKNNLCERDGIEKVAASSERNVLIDNDCSVVDWRKNTNKDDSRNKAELLLYWNVFKEQKRFYQK
jgi:hypothetical protein